MTPKMGPKMAQNGPFWGVPKPLKMGQKSCPQAHVGKLRKNAQKWGYEKKRKKRVFTRFSKTPFLGSMPQNRWTPKSLIFDSNQWRYSVSKMTKKRRQNAKITKSQKWRFCQNGPKNDPFLGHFWRVHFSVLQKVCDEARLTPKMRVKKRWRNSTFFYDPSFSEFKPASSVCREKTRLGKKQKFKKTKHRFVAFRPNRQGMLKITDFSQKP